ncbi:hypothetical protein N8I77_004609 [Diaporthe amygdali]|uniref:Amino acid permease/ SLC12A domain-containing protein n=1 Tax=Phomopsis amygdali TaxID=1214568 RepID=A0AAD9SMW1_PHOAM|nr:hypothetical protein N8I77_004609 [Diaporthe amygdali]
MAGNLAERDIELNILNFKEDYSLANGESYLTREPTYEMPRRSSRAGPGAWRRWVDSFRRDPHSRMTPKNAFTANPGWPGVGPPAGPDDDDDDDDNVQNPGRSYYDVRAANYRTAHSLLARELKGRHLQMIAIGGSIGTGLFISSGSALNTGGPASVLLAYMIIGLMLYCVMQALGELAVVFPIAGSFSAYSTRFLDPAWGFAMGWNYALQWLIVLPLEIIAASITISYWNAGINKAVFVTVFLAVIISINLCGVKGYGEAEFIFAIVKVTAVIGFILLGVVINIGGTQDGGYIGGTYWQNPGSFNNGFKGLCSVFVTAAFAFAGTEMVGLAAAETANPRKSLPTAIKQVFWRISLFYILALTLVGLLVPYDDERLLGAKSVADTSASPFVIAIQDAGIQVLPSVMNVVILVAVMSVGNSSVFGSSRTLAALADQGQAPAWLSYIDRRGRPLMAILCASIFGFLAYLADIPQQGEVLNWLLAISALSSIFTWASICLAHIRFRTAWRAHGRSLDELAFRAQAGVFGSWVGLILNILILAAQFWTGAWPVNYGEYSVQANVQTFFLNYTAAPVVIIMYVGYKLWFRTRIVRNDEMDIDTGRRDFNLSILLAQEMEEKRSWPKWKKWYKFFC